MATSIEVFISHISDDRRYAELIQNVLKRKSLGIVTVFHTSDPRSLRPGTDWWPELRSRLDKSSVLLAIISARSLLSPWIHFEAGAVWKRDVPVIPCCIPGITIQEIKPPLSFMQGVELGLAKGWQILLQEISDIAGIDCPSVDDAESLAETMKRLEVAVASEMVHPRHEPLLFEQVRTGVIHVRNVSGRVLRSFFANWDNQAHPAVSLPSLENGAHVSILLPRVRETSPTGGPTLEVNWIDDDTGHARSQTFNPLDRLGHPL